MEQLIQVHAKRNKSLRDKILADVVGLEKAGLSVRKEKTKGRNPGWAEITSDDKSVNGTIKISWEPTTEILTCRISNMGTGKPYPILGNFINYLMEKHKTKIKFLVVVPE